MQRNKNLEEQHKMFARKIEQLENDREILVTKHKRDKESIEIELDEKRQLVKRYENEFKEVSSSKMVMKKVPPCTFLNQDQGIRRRE